MAGKMEFICSFVNIYFHSCHSWDSGPVGTPGNSWWKCAVLFSKSWPYFRPENFIFHTRLSDQTSKIHTHFQTRNIMSWLLRFERKQKISSNAFWIILMFLVLSYSFGIDRINIQFHTLPWFPRKPNPIPDQNGQSPPIFRPKRPKNPTLWGGTYLYGLCKRIPPRTSDSAIVLSFSRLGTYRYPVIC